MLFGFEFVIGAALAIVAIWCVVVLAIVAIRGVLIVVREYPLHVLFVLALVFCTISAIYSTNHPQASKPQIGTTTGPALASMTAEPSSPKQSFICSSIANDLTAADPKLDWMMIYKNCMPKKWGQEAKTYGQ